MSVKLYNKPINNRKPYTSPYSYDYLFSPYTTPKEINDKECAALEAKHYINSSLSGSNHYEWDEKVFNFEKDYKAYKSYDDIQAFVGGYDRLCFNGLVFFFKTFEISDDTNLAIAYFGDAPSSKSSTSFNFLLEHIIGQATCFRFFMDKYSGNISKKDVLTEHLETDIYCLDAPLYTQFLQVLIELVSLFVLNDMLSSLVSFETLSFQPYFLCRYKVSTDAANYSCYGSKGVSEHAYRFFKPNKPHIKRYSLSWLNHFSSQVANLYGYNDSICPGPSPCYYLNAEPFGKGSFLRYKIVEEYNTGQPIIRLRFGNISSRFYPQLSKVVGDNFVSKLRRICNQSLNPILSTQTLGYTFDFKPSIPHTLASSECLSLDPESIDSAYHHFCLDLHAFCKVVAAMCIVKDVFC